MMGMWETASGLTRLRGPPDQKLSSFTCMESDVTPPSITAPMRPFPMTKASLQLSAGVDAQIRLRFDAESGFGIEADDA